MYHVQIMLVYPMASYFWRSYASIAIFLQRSLAETLACAASCIKDPEASAQ
jgi:hypothetical protein